MTMFVAALVANATYSSSIFIRMCTLAGLWPRLPWIIGSAGVLFFDSVVRARLVARYLTPRVDLHPAFVLQLETICSRFR